MTIRVKKGTNSNNIINDLTLPFVVFGILVLLIEANRQTRLSQNHQQPRPTFLCLEWQQVSKH